MRCCDAVEAKSPRVGVTFDLLKGCRCRVGKLHDKTSGANVAAELLAKQVFDVGFVIDDKNIGTHSLPLIWL